MRSVLASFLAMLALLALAGLAAGAERRVALVVGNSSYPSAPLANPKNDAADIADALTQLGFEVIRHIDAGRNDINDALEEFQRKASDADAALFYYAGHAMQYNDQNYLLPVDAVLRDQYSVPQLTSFSRIRDALSTCGECVKIMILDACRNNPLADRFLREQVAKNRSLSSPARGLARLSDKPEGMIVIFATQAGDVAADGAGRNSPFTQALLAELKKPELGLSELFNDVALDVTAATGKKQIPEIQYSPVRTLNQFYLNQNEGDNTAFEKLDFADIQALRQFIEKYPQSSKRRVVESLVAVMERQARERAEEARQEAQRKLDAEQARLEADAKQQAEARQAETDRAKREAEAEAERKRDEDRARLATEADAKRQAEARLLEADRLKQEAETESKRKFEADRARLAAEADAKRQAEARQAEADRLKRDSEADAQRKLDADRARLAAADAKRQVEARQAEADRLRRDSEAEAQRKLDADRARLAAEADAKRQAEADRLRRDSEAEAQRKLDADRVRLAAEADAKQRAEALQAEAERLKRDADAQQKLDADRKRLAAEADARRQAEAKTAAPVLEGQENASAAQPQVQGTGTADPHSVARVEDEAQGEEARRTALETTCKNERARFVALKQRGLSGLKDLAAFKAHLVCADMAHEVEAALEAMSVRAEQRRQTAARSNPGATVTPSHSASKPSVARLRPGLNPATAGRSNPEPGVRQAQRNNRERNRLYDMGSSFQVPPAPAVSASVPTVDFRGGGF